MNEKSFFEIACEVFDTNNECAQSLESAINAELLCIRMNERERKVIDRVIECVDEWGYLKKSTQEIFEYCACWYGELYELAEIEKAVKTLKSLDLNGYGAGSLQECLLMQLRHFGTSDNVKMAYAIVAKTFEDLKFNRHQEICRKLGITIEQVRKCVSTLRRCTASPAKVYESDASFAVNKSVRIDFQAVTNNGKVSIEIEIPEKIEREQEDTENAESQDFTKESVTEFRKKMQAVADEIASIQQAYLQSGDKCDLNPLTESEIAERTGVQIVCVSRIAQKYIKTKFGIFPLREFFTQVVPKTQIVSASAKEQVREIIESENKSNPLTDEQIAQKLHEMGYEIGRRTVVKYREQMGYAVARLRKKW